MTQPPMLRTPTVIRALLEQSGYVWDADVEGWVRPGEKPGLFQGRMLDGSIAAGLTAEQVREWIKAGQDT